ncbi:MAG: TonB-dependent receptor plug domain-containing protein [Sphingobium sp.]
MTGKHFSRTTALAAVLTIQLAISAPALAGSAADADADAAAADADQQSIVVTGRVMTATLTATAAIEYGNNVQIVGAQEIAASGASNFAELAQFLIKGANVGYSPDEGEYTIRLDGGGDRDTLVVLDGVPLYDRGPALEDIWGTTTIDPHMIDRVEVFRGGNSLFFGSNGGIGVISIVTKRPDGTNKVELGASYGSFNSRELWSNARFAVDPEGRHSFMIYGSSQQTDGPRIFNPASFPDNLVIAGAIQKYPLNRNNVGIKYLWKISDQTEFRANGQYTQIEFQDPFPDTETYSPNRVRYPIVDMNLQHRWSPKLMSEIAAYWSNPKLNNTETFADICLVRTGCTNVQGQPIAYGVATGRSTPFPNKGFGDASKVGGFQELGLNVRHTLTLPDLIEAVGGMQIVSYKDDSDPVYRVSKKRNTTTGLYVDLRPTIPFSPETKISLAGRIDFNKAFDSRFIWKFGLRHPIGPFYVRANGGTSYSLPRTNELGAQSPTLVGNPNLQTETTETYNGAVGFSKGFGDVTVNGELGYFRTDISNRIRTTSGLAQNTYFNDPAVTEIRGLTAELGVNVGKTLSANLSFTKQDAKPRVLPGQTTPALQINETPEFMIQGTASWNSPDQTFHVNLFPRYQGPEYATGGVNRIGSGGEIIPQFRHNFGNYFVMNASVGLWVGEDRQHRFQLRLVNAFNEKYAERYGYANNRFSQAFYRGEIVTNGPGYFYGYEFEGKPRSVYFSYTTEF